MKKNEVLKGWFVVEIRTRFGKKVKSALESLVARRNLSDKIFSIVIPSKKEMNSYILVNMLADPDALSAILRLQYVRKFLGSNCAPLPLSADEVKCML